ncbi:hypothetical protein FNV43_RR09821 [Rhamnella rubrinervis]|uniref:Myb/SANT-like domain-containing protein n=1 Tax=Rhamnella rubrinervis TaxID=2594499 RepID=A0A8K0HAR5_9ROSA|nr:hypothetical protein FNV43_RR09821 [Rhamnella rubrinervis]
MMTFTQYQSRLKWFKTRYNNYIELIRNNSGFGWDPVTKKFTASDEVWENYLKAHPTHKSYRTDLQIVVGNGAVGRYSIGLGDETDARTFGVGENISSGLDDLTYDSSGAFIESGIFIYIMSHSNIYENDEVDEEEMEEQEMEEELYEAFRYSLMAICQAITHVLNELGVLCSIIREKTLLHDTRFVCVEEMLASFLMVVGQNSRYCLVRKTYNRSQYTISRSFNKILKALNTIAVDMMAKPGSSVPEKIRESTRFYPYFKLLLGVRYHLQDFLGQGRDPENANELFNLRHSSLRNVIERIFGIFKSRFTILKQLLHFHLHNKRVGVSLCRSDEFPIERIMRVHHLHHYRLMKRMTLINFETRNKGRMLINGGLL